MALVNLRSDVINIILLFLCSVDVGIRFSYSSTRIVKVHFHNFFISIVIFDEFESFNLHSVLFHLLHLRADRFYVG